VYTGAAAVLNSVLSTEYLFQAVRVKGGAYGAHFELGRRGFSYFYSYRDPHLGRTLAAFAGAGEFLKTFNPGGRELRKYRIGALNEDLRPRTPPQEAERAQRLYFCGVTQEALAREREETLATRAEDLQAMAGLFADPLRAACVVGSAEKILAEKNWGTPKYL
jgi:Zn-dependent M16 (insulinase) family peptidase